MISFTKKIKSFISLLFFAGMASAQVPVANFTLSPNPVCLGQVLQITDISGGSPTAWSYTVSGFGPLGGSTLTTQNPTVAFNFQGTFSITLIATNANGSSAAVVHTVQVLPAPGVAINPANQTSCIGGNVNSFTVTQAGPGGGGGVLTYSWSTGATTSVLTVPAPSVTTVYSCVVTSTNGCSSTRTSTITIGSPTINVGSAPANICIGSTSTLTATGSGGGPFTYTWSTAANTRTTTVSTPGVYNVTVTNGVGCTGTQSFSISASNTVAVNVTATPSLLCAGNTATLRATGATSYTWSNGATAATTTLSPSTSSSYTVTGATGTCSGTAAISIIVTASPNIVTVASPSSICTGQSSTLTATGADNFTWTAGVGVGSLVIVSPTTTITYTVRGVNQGCPPRTSTVMVKVGTSPTITVASSASLICAGDEIALAANGAVTYTWTNTGATSGIILISPSVTTIYTVTGASANNCTNTAVITQNVSDCTGLQKSAEINSFQVYPNPAMDKIFIKGNVGGNFVMYSVTGEVVKAIDAAEAEAGINLQNLPSGIYSLSNGKGFTAKIIIAK